MTTINYILYIITIFLLVGCVEPAKPLRQVHMSQISSYKNILNSNITISEYKTEWIQPINKKEKCKFFDEGYEYEGDPKDDYEISWDGVCKNGKAIGLGKLLLDGRYQTYSIITYLKNGKIDNYIYIEYLDKNQVFYGKIIYQNNVMKEIVGNTATVDGNKKIINNTFSGSIQLKDRKSFGSSINMSPEAKNINFSKLTGENLNNNFFGKVQFYNKSDINNVNIWGSINLNTYNWDSYIVVQTADKVENKRFDKGTFKEMVILPQTYLNQVNTLVNKATEQATSANNYASTALSLKRKYDRKHSNASNGQKSNINKHNDSISLLLKKSKPSKTSDTKWLFIVGIENYEFTASVPYSKNSANEFKAVMKKRLGIPEKNIRTLINQGATSAKINYNLKDMLRRVKNGDTVYFYYSGHGIPVPSKNNEPYMLAQDMNPAYIDDDRFKLQNIYQQLSNSKASKVIVFIDSCFSGGTDNQALIKGVAATRLKPKKVTFDNSKMVVISAGSGTQYSNKYDEKSNRLFSYYVMRGLINNNTDTQRLYNYVKSNVQEKSYEMGASYEQVPVYNGNIKLEL